MSDPTPTEAATQDAETLPREQQRAMQLAVRLQWFNIAYLILTVAVMFTVAGQSKAMRAGWIEDALSMLSPVAFLVGAWVLRKPPTPRYPYGRHRSMAMAHLVGGSALLAMGVYLVGESALGVVSGERPPIGLAVLFGHAFWSGWLMSGVAAVTVIVPFFLGRAKMRLSRVLHDKVLYANAQMNKADWSTGLATSVGVLGVGLGLWWADAAAAALVGLSIAKDGVDNLRAVTKDLIDGRATTFDQTPHPLIGRVEEKAREAAWVRDARARIRDQSHVLHTELFLVPTAGAAVTAGQLDDLRARIHQLDWKLHDVVVTVTGSFPAYFGVEAADVGEDIDDDSAEDDDDRA